MSPSKTDIKHIQSTLLSWYEEKGRRLPWRQTRVAYRILVSEIMLQQTQVDRVIEYYKRFLKMFPTVKALAEAKTSDVITAWAGLGYNRRALFLQRTAQAVRERHAGRFPQDLDALKALPGVGDYTARAILSFAFGKPVPMMDTNHRRFYGRLFFGKEIPKDKDLLVFAEALFADLNMDDGSTRSYDWNQALMDFGSAICLSKEPQCGICPLQQYCQTYPLVQSGEWQKMQAVKKKNKKKVIPFKDTDRYIRGRIVDLLRQKEHISLNAAQKAFADVEKTRFDKIIAKLNDDGLIKIEKNRMMLP